MLGEKKQDPVIRQFIITISLISQLSLWRVQQAEGKLKGCPGLVGANQSQEQESNPCAPVPGDMVRSHVCPSLPYHILALIIKFYSFTHLLNKCGVLGAFLTQNTAASQVKSLTYILAQGNSASV